MKISELALGLAILASTSLPSQNAHAIDIGNPECIAPANAGGGWDFTCRQVGKLLHDLKLVSKPVRVVNLAGGGGGVAFVEVVSKRNANNELIVAASSATSTRLAQGSYPGADMDQVRWLGAVGADYGIIAVSKDSPISSLTELFDAVKADPASIAFAGGSAKGGWDHLKLLIAAKSAGIEDLGAIKYVAFEGGGEAVTQLLGGHIQAFSGDISEAKGFSDSGDIKILAVLSEERLPGEGFDKFPTAREQGVDVIGANWRGFYGPGGMSDEAYEFWVDSIKTVYDSPEWKDAMAANGLMPLAKTGKEFQDFVREQVNSAATLSREIGIN